MAFNFDKVSKWIVPFTITPILLIAPMPPKKDRGTERTSAHGQDTTKNTRALSIQSEKLALGTTTGTKAKRQAETTTIGVYQTANRLMRFSGRDLLAEASSIKFNRRVIEEFLCKVFTFKVITLP